MVQVRSLIALHLAPDIFRHPFLSLTILVGTQIGTGCGLSGKNLEQQRVVMCTMAQGLTQYSGISLAPDPTDKSSKMSLTPLSSEKPGQDEQCSLFLSNIPFLSFVNVQIFLPNFFGHRTTPPSKPADKKPNYTRGVQSSENYSSGISK